MYAMQRWNLTCSNVHAQAAHDAELRRVLLRLTAALGLHVGGVGGATAAAAAAAELDTEAGAGASAEAGWGSDGNARFAHAKSPALRLKITHPAETATLLAPRIACLSRAPHWHGYRTCSHFRSTGHLV